MMFYDMAIDAGADTEEERWQMADLFEEEHMYYLQQSWDEEQEQRLNIVIHVLPPRICSSVRFRAPLS